MTVNPETAEWADGPKVAAWLAVIREDKGIKAWPDNIQRRVWEWRNGRPASVWVLDRILVWLGQTLADVPADFWITHTPPRGTRGHRNRDERLRLLAEIDEGGPTVRLRYGIDTRTIQRWRKEFS